MLECLGMPLPLHERAGCGLPCRHTGFTFSVRTRLPSGHEGGGADSRGALVGAYGISHATGSPDESGGATVPADRSLQ